MVHFFWYKDKRRSCPHTPSEDENRHVISLSLSPSCGEQENCKPNHFCSTSTASSCTQGPQCVPLNNSWQASIWPDWTFDMPTLWIFEFKKKGSTVVVGKHFTFYFDYTLNIHFYCCIYGRQVELLPTLKLQKKLHFTLDQETIYDLLFGL